MSSFRTPSSSSGGFWSIERVVALLTPVFGGVAGWLFTIIADAIPGVHISKSGFTVVFVTGAAAAVTAALKWLHGRQKFVELTTDAELMAERVIDAIKSNPVGGVALADVEDVLRKHTDQIIQAIGGAVHAPVSAEQIAEQMVQRLLAGRSPASPAATTAQAVSGTVPAS